MGRDLQAPDLLTQLDAIEAQFARYYDWQKRARRYLFLKLPIFGGLLYAGARFDMLQMVIPLMLVVGSVWYLVPWSRVRALDREREALLARIEQPEKDGDVL